jgi:hypothetical protein
MSQPAYEPQQQYPERTMPARRPVAAAPAAPIAARRPYSPAGVAARFILTALGAAGLIIGGFLNWVSNIDGVRLDDRALYQMSFIDTSVFVRTMGFGAIVLGLLALLGLAFRSGWLTRIAGALGIVGFVMFAIQLYRANGDQVIQLGGWICLAGAIVALIGGFLGTRRVVATTAPATTTVE